MMKKLATILLLSLCSLSCFAFKLVNSTNCELEISFSLDGGQWSGFKVPKLQTVKYDELPAGMTLHFEIRATEPGSDTPLKKYYKFDGSTTSIIMFSANKQGEYVLNFTK